MALTPEQRRVLTTIKQVAAAKGASPKQVKAAIETGLVESGLTNPSGGDADSAGWRQERAGLYKDPTNLRASVERFFNETAAVKDKYGRAGDLAAAVQRPAAQYRGRYQQQSGRADQLLGGAQGGAGGQGAAGSSVRSSTTTTPGVDNSSGRAAAIAAFLGSKGSDPLDFALQIKGLQDTPGTSVTRTTRTPAASASSHSTGASTSAKGVATFDGKKVAAWIAPALEYARQRGWKGTINSGYRSLADQTRIYDSGVRPAARPGTSNHEFTSFPGGAVDVSDAAQLSHILKTSPYARKLVWAGGKDPVHFSHPHNGAY